MSLVFTFLYITNQATPLTFERAFDFQINLVGMSGIGFKDLDNIVKKDFIENEPEEKKDQALESTIERDKYI